MTARAVQTLPAYVRLARLDRLMLGEEDRDALSTCIRVLRDAGLEVTPSRLAAHGIIGGTSRVAVLDTSAFANAFFIEPVEGGTRVVVTAPGQASQRETLRSLRGAAEHVVAIYRERALLPAAPGSLSLAREKR
jgi:hypothetical protein